jgi:quercetin dioxygenase-like cupin family protein
MATDESEDGGDGDGRETTGGAAAAGAADRNGDRPRPVLKRADEVTYEPVTAADGLEKGVLLDASDGAPHFAVRRFRLAPGAEVPRHTNRVEHEQYVLEGDYVVGIGEEEYRVGPGDSLLIPAGTVHWYRNDASEPGAFLCAVPHGDDEIELIE